MASAARRHGQSRGPKSSYTPCDLTQDLTQQLLQRSDYSVTPPPPSDVNQPDRASPKTSHRANTTILTRLASMQDGKTHSGVDYVWPTKILRPTHSVQIVYLDLNHWIALARAHNDRTRGGAAGTALDACIRARDSQKAIFPISALTYYELAKIGQDNRRRDLRTVIELLSEYSVIVSPVKVIEREVDAALEARYGSSSAELEPVQYIDRGWVSALGAEDYADEMATIRAREVERVARVTPEGAGLFAEVFDNFQSFKERAILDGPSSTGDQSSMTPYVQVDKIAEVMNARLKQEESLRDAFNQNPNCRRGRIRDYVMTRSVKDDFLPIMAGQLAKRGIVGDELFESRDRMRETFDSMPTCDVVVTIKTMYHRDGAHRWSINDMYDIDALSAAMPYCDVVLTDREVASQANNSQLASRLNTIVSHDLGSLSEFLEERAD